MYQIEASHNRPLRKDEDLFERVQFAQQIAKDVSSIGLNNLPLSLGLFGGWGSGKTTILRWIKQDLDKNICIYVSARIPGGNILEPVLRKLSELRGAESKSHIKRLGSKLLRILPALSVGFPVLPVQLSGKEIAEIIKKSRQAPDTIMQFRKFVMDICGDEKKLIILVDDMDRLPPTNAVDVMESYEILFGLVPTTEEEFETAVAKPQGEGESGEAAVKQSATSTTQLERATERKEGEVPVLFIFGVDPGILKSGLVAKYGKDALSESMAAAYIAKHFQIVENVPMTEREQTIRLICERIGVYYDDEKVKAICNKIDNSITEAATANLRYFFQAVGATRDLVDRRGLHDNASVFHDARGRLTLTVKDNERQFVLTFFFIYLLYLHTPEIVRWMHKVPWWRRLLSRVDTKDTIWSVPQDRREGLQMDEYKRDFEGGELEQYLLRNSRIVRPLATAVSILNPPDDQGSEARVKNALAAVLGA